MESRQFSSCCRASSGCTSRQVVRLCHCARPCTTSTDVARLDELADVGILRVRSCLEAGHEECLGSHPRFGDRFRFVEVGRQRGLAVHVLARLERVNDDLLVLVGGGSDKHGLDALVVECAAVVVGQGGGRRDLGGALRKDLGLVGIAEAVDRRAGGSKLRERRQISCPCLPSPITAQPTAGPTGVSFLTSARSSVATTVDAMDSPDAAAA